MHKISFGIFFKKGLRRDTTRADDAQGTSTQSHISPSIIVYEDYKRVKARTKEVPRKQVGVCANLASG